MRGDRLPDAKVGISPIFPIVAARNLQSFTSIIDREAYILLRKGVDKLSGDGYAPRRREMERAVDLRIENAERQFAFGVGVAADLFFDKILDVLCDLVGG